VSRVTLRVACGRGEGPASVPRGPQSAVATTAGSPSGRRRVGFPLAWWWGAGESGRSSLPSPERSYREGEGKRASGPEGAAPFAVGGKPTQRPSGASIGRGDYCRESLRPAPGGFPPHPLATPGVARLSRQAALRAAGRGELRPAGRPTPPSTQTPVYPRAPWRSCAPLRPRASPPNTGPAAPPAQGSAASFAPPPRRGS